ncbi:UDP-N-acetylglucosamine transporter UGNT [Salix suchowensis]|nr:UDP-N-acetylglucosamine transporter UGNT [Salix suchowensis]
MATWDQVKEKKKKKNSGFVGGKSFPYWGVLPSFTHGTVLFCHFLPLCTIFNLLNYDLNSCKHQYHSHLVQLSYSSLVLTSVALCVPVVQLNTDFISVGIIILGAFVAGARDLSFDAYGYAVVFVANICTAVYLASIARIGKSSGLNSFGLMWCNGIICGPILLFWTTIRGDLEAIRNFPFLLSPGFQVVMLLSCIMAFLINYFVFMNTTLNSALTQTICGNLKDLFTIGFGWILFGGLPFDLLNVVGQSLGFFGSCLYAYYKLKGQ